MSWSSGVWSNNALLYRVNSLTKHRQKNRIVISFQQNSAKNYSQVPRTPFGPYFNLLKSQLCCVIFFICNKLLEERRTSAVLADVSRIMKASACQYSSLVSFQLFYSSRRDCVLAHCFSLLCCSAIDICSICTKVFKPSYNTSVLIFSFDLTVFLKKNKCDCSDTMNSKLKVRLP